MSEVNLEKFSQRFGGLSQIEDGWWETLDSRFNIGKVSKTEWTVGAGSGATSDDLQLMNGVDLGEIIFETRNDALVWLGENAGA